MNITKITDAIEELAAAARSVGHADGYEEGRSNAIEELSDRCLDIDADDARVLLPILESAYEAAITTQPWQARIIRNHIDTITSAAKSE